MQTIVRRDFLKSVGSVAAAATLAGAAFAPAASAANREDHGRGDHGCWDNDHSCDLKGCCYDPCIDEQFDYDDDFDIGCRVEGNNYCFKVCCEGSGKSWTKHCDDSKKHRRWHMCSSEQDHQFCWDGQAHCWQICCKQELTCDDGDRPQHWFNCVVNIWIDCNGDCCYDVCYQNCSNS